MNTGDVHIANTELPDRLDESSRARLKTDLEAVVSATSRDDAEQIREDSQLNTQKKETEAEGEKQQAIDLLKQLITQEFEHLSNGIDRYNWVQKDIEAQIRNMLHIVNTEHDKDSQVERMVAAVARDIAESTISEDIHGPIARKGYNKQFFAETDRLGDIYQSRLVEIIEALEHTKYEDNASQRQRIIDESVRKPLEHTKSALYGIHEELIRILRAQRDTIKGAVESFRQLQYFQDETVWQNPAYRLLNDYCEKALLAMEAQLGRIKDQSETDDGQIDALLKESQLLLQQMDK